MLAPRRRRTALAGLAALSLVIATVTVAAPAHAVDNFSVTVVWIDDAGVQRPVSGAIVTVSTRNYVDVDDRSGFTVRSYTAGASGIASVFPASGTGAIEVRVLAEAPDGEIGGVPVTAAYWGQSQTIEAADYMHIDRVQNIVIALHPKTTVVGSVVATDSTPVGANASVLLWHRGLEWMPWQPFAEVRTDASGRFEAMGVPIGDYRLEVRSAASGTLFTRSFHPLSPDLDGAQTFPVASGASTDVGQLTVERWSLESDRIQGPDRYATAVKVSNVIYPEPLEYSPQAVYLVSGRSFADALSASPLAARRGVLLLTAPTALPAVVEAELQRLKPENIVIVGGTGVISASVESRVRSIAQSWGVLDVTRIGGTDRYDTSRRLVRHAIEGGHLPEGRPVFIATGTNFPDALSAASAAGAYGMPLILVGGINESSFAPATRQLLDDLRPTRIYVAGGWATVSPIAMNTYAWQAGVPVTRFGGADRYETSRMINALFFGDSDLAIVASGTQFPDALAAGPLSVALEAPLVLTPPSCVNAALARSLARQGTDLALLVGGPGALSARVEAMSSC